MRVREYVSVRECESVYLKIIYVYVVQQSFGDLQQGGLLYYFQCCTANLNYILILSSTFVFEMWLAETADFKFGCT